jgi:hypothetical protein
VFFAIMRRIGCTGVGSVLVLLSTMNGGALAVISPYHPTGEYAPFYDCPLGTPGLSDCVLAEMTGGELVVGGREVPIDRRLVLMGGFIEEPSGMLKFVGAADGNTLSKATLYVPGGLFDTLPPASLSSNQKARFEEALDASWKDLSVTPELAGPAGNIGISVENLLNQKDTALRLPLAMRLGNRLLSGLGAIGSREQPVVLELTVGRTSPPLPNTPIQGALGGLFFNPSFTMVELSGTRFVDDAFSVPGASGGGLDSFIDAQLGLPSPAGRNTAILQAPKLLLANAQTVKESE